MTKTFNSFATTISDSEGDIYTAPSKTMTMLLQVVNPTGSSVNCEVWMTDDSNNHVACLFPSQAITTYNGISDTAKHIIPSGYKIRATASTASTIYIEGSVVEGM